eukprot:15461594-Alexandrium_andersonii.AAC.1
MHQARCLAYHAAQQGGGRGAAFGGSSGPMLKHTRGCGFLHHVGEEGTGSSNLPTGRAFSHHGKVGEWSHICTGARMLQHQHTH